MNETDGTSTNRNHSWYFEWKKYVHFIENSLKEILEFVNAMPRNSVHFVETVRNLCTATCELIEISDLNYQVFEKWNIKEIFRSWFNNSESFKCIGKMWDDVLNDNLNDNLFFYEIFKYIEEHDQGIMSWFTSNQLKKWFKDWRCEINRGKKKGFWNICQLPL